MKCSPPSQRSTHLPARCYCVDAPPVAPRRRGAGPRAIRGISRRAGLGAGCGRARLGSGRRMGGRRGDRRTARCRLAARRRRRIRTRGCCQAAAVHCGSGLCGQARARSSRRRLGRHGGAADQRVARAAAAACVCGHARGARPARLSTATRGGAGAAVRMVELRPPACCGRSGSAPFARRRMARFTSGRGNSCRRNRRDRCYDVARPNPPASSAQAGGGGVRARVPALHRSRRRRGVPAGHVAALPRAAGGALSRGRSSPGRAGRCHFADRRTDRVPGVIA